ncbi:TPA: integrase arm-type DNA-binding domain-containing protein, partial [Pseudomonas aeruginosa]|nr:integrase arm-type DNA-binding domain-containing protein [Pseudomonas aeruginosa]
MALSDLSVRKAKATGKEYTLADFDGLSLAVAPGGGKSWHFRYQWFGKQKRMSLGTYPELSLRDARIIRDEARALLAKGTNPHTHRKHKRATARLTNEYTFKAVFLKWLAHRGLTFEEGRQTTQSLIPRIFANDVLPLLGKRSIYEIRRVDLLEVIGNIERRKALSVAEKVRTWFNQMFRYALVVVPGLEQNPASDLDVVAQPLPPVNHNPFLRMPELPKYLQRVRKYRGRLRTQLGLRLLMLTGVRTGELRQATPDQFDLDQGLWTIPANVVKQLKTDMRRKRQLPQNIPPYIVPLSVQAIEIVRYLLEEFKPAQRYLLHGDVDIKSRISENTLNSALKRMGYRDLLTGHGMRATMSTALNEIGYPKVWVDAQLSHVDPNKVSATYNHAEYVEQRRRMMQDWADRLDLFEQNKVKAASTPLTVHLEQVPEPAGTNSGPFADRSSNASPILLVSTSAEAMPLVMASEHRLPAVPVPRAAQEEALSDVQRQRMALVDLFEAPHNLPVAEFAKLAGKSRRWISYEVKAGNLLALNIGNRGQRVPDWHLDPAKHALIQALLKL